MADFNIAVEKVLQHEGGYTPGLPNDPGGATNFGISKRAYPDLDIEHLTREQAIEIYEHDYWTGAMQALSDQQLANCALDCAVNEGRHAAESFLAVSNGELRKFQIERLLRYTRLNKPEFYHSWFTRCLDV